MAGKHAVKLTAKFERNLDDVAAFLQEAGAPDAFDELLEDLLATVVPNLERFPNMGHPFVERPLRSVEASNAFARLERTRASLSEKGELREYVLAHYLLLYLRCDSAVYLLSIRHHRQLSFDLNSLWLTR